MLCLAPALYIPHGGSRPLRAAKDLHYLFLFATKQAYFLSPGGLSLLLIVPWHDLCALCWRANLSCPRLCFSSARGDVLLSHLTCPVPCQPVCRTHGRALDPPPRLRRSPRLTPPGTAPPGSRIGQVADVVALMPLHALRGSSRRPDSPRTPRADELSLFSP